jgi:FkbM family methyltransferase
MATPRVRYNPLLTQHLVNQNVFVDHPFTLIDVGASGGIEQHWLVFAKSLLAFGFEPLIAEVERLNRIEKHSNISYIAALLTGPSKMAEEHDRIVEKIQHRNNQPFPRTSAVRAMSLLAMDYAKSVFDPSGTGAMTDERITLDKFISEKPDVDVDFIKIDTDGYDYDVLCGGDVLLTKSPVLGLFVECQFHGSVHQDANLFSNIDRFLRSRGYSLFDIEVYRYSRGTLPKPFFYDITAQTLEGQVLWGDALYLRDAGDPDYEKMWEIQLYPQKLLKLACIFEIYGLEDCAAELLEGKRRELENLVDIDHCLNLLTPELGGKKVVFQEYVRRFEKNVRDWFPSHYNSQGFLEEVASRETTPESGGGHIILERDMEAQKQEIARLRQQLNGWQIHWRAVENSAGWRLLSAWRRGRDRLVPEGTRRRRLYEAVIGSLRPLPR